MFWEHIPYHTRYIAYKWYIPYTFHIPYSISLYAIHGIKLSIRQFVDL